MSKTRRAITLAAATLAIAFVTALPARAAGDAEEAGKLVNGAQATIGRFAAHKQFPTLGPALGKARGVLIFPQVLKAGFLLGGSGGSGVLLVRDRKTGRWSEPAFYTMGSASFGFQAGASAAEVVMIVNSDKGLDTLFSNKAKLGGDASVAIGTEGVGTGVSTDSDFVVYSTVQGAFAGLSVDGAVLDVRKALNKAYYGKPVSAVGIVIKHEASNPGSAGLRAAVKKAAK